MRRYLPIIALCILTAACSGSPSAPAPVTPPATISPAPAVPVIASSACPQSLVLGFSLDLPFYQQMGCNAFEGPVVAPRHWTQAPRLYIRTVDESGAPIDAVTLQTVESAMVGIAPSLTAGKFGVSVERGTEQRDGVSGWITVRWPSSASAFNACGSSQIAVDGGSIQLNYLRPTCSCNGSRIYARVAAHELGHALGYWHTDTQGDLMFGQTPLTCDVGVSAREQQAIAYHYR